MKPVTLVLTLLLSCQFALSQYIPIDFQTKITKADLIIEGEILSQETFVAEDGYIYTKNLLIPSKLLKGYVAPDSKIEIITYGGEYNGRYEKWTHLLQLQKNDYGILLPTYCTKIWTRLLSNFRF